MNKSVNHSALKRIQSLLDAGSFVEIGAGINARSTNFHLYKETTPADGVITGYGLIDGRLVYIYSQDSTILGGSIGEMHSRKITQLYDMAMNMGAPIIGILDCSGIRLQESIDALYGLGSIYKKQSLASGVIPQLTIVMGNCGGGISMIPALSDFTFIESETGNLFLQSPNTIPKNSREKCDTSKVDWKASHSQNIDICGTEDEIYNEVRRFIGILPSNNRSSVVQEVCNDDLNRLCEGIDSIAADTAALLSLIADNYEYIETKKFTAKELSTGFIRLNGMTIGCIANRRSMSDSETISSDVLTADGMQKAASFVKFCDSFRIPLLTLCNASGFESSFEAEIHGSSSCTAFISAYAYATIPKVTIILERAMGSAGIVMGSKSLGTNLVFAWNDAQIGAMDGVHASKILYEGESTAMLRQKAIEYDALYNKASASASRGYVDVLIKPEDTRKYAISAFDMLATKMEARSYKKHPSV